MKRALLTHELGSIWHIGGQQEGKIWEFTQRDSAKWRDSRSHSSPDVGQWKETAVSHVQWLRWSLFRPLDSLAKTTRYIRVGARGSSDAYKERTEAKRKSLCCEKVSCRLICLSLPSPPLSWHPVAVCSDQWSRDRSPLLRAASPLQTLRQMTRCSTDGVAHGIICMRVHTHSLPRTQTPYVHAHLHTEIYTSSWDVLTFPLGLPEMSSPPAAANSPFQPLTLPGAGAVRWSTNDLCAFRLSRLLQSVHPSHISHCLCNYIPPHLLHGLSFWLHLCVQSSPSVPAPV